MILKPDETQLVGNWQLVGGRMVEDETSQRINALVRGQLQQIAVSSGGWDKLFLDPSDGRLWELTHSASGTHGGGPRTLSVISETAAHNKYEF